MIHSATCWALSWHSAPRIYFPVFLTTRLGALVKGVITTSSNHLKIYFRWTIKRLIWIIDFRLVQIKIRSKLLTVPLSNQVAMDRFYNEKCTQNCCEWLHLNDWTLEWFHFRVRKKSMYIFIVTINISIDINRNRIQTADSGAISLEIYFIFNLFFKNKHISLSISENKCVFTSRW